MTSDKPFKKNYAIDTCMNECEWDDAITDARSIFELEKKQGRSIVWLTAGKIDWRGNSGFKISTIDDIDEDKNGDLWSWISGINGDWSLRFIAPFDPETDQKMMLSCSHHDQPIGGERVVTFYSPREFYELARCNGMTKQQIVEWLSDNSYIASENASIDEIVEAIGTICGDELADFIDS